MTSNQDDSQFVISCLQGQIEDLHREKIAMAILLVRGAGGRIVVSGTQELSLTNTSHIQEDRDPDTGDRVFTTFETPHTQDLH